MKLEEFFVDCFALTNTDATQRLYEPYWELLVRLLGDQELKDITPGNIRIASKIARDQQAGSRRRNHQNGLYAQEHLIAAARMLFRRAVEEGYATSNPALQVEKPKRPDVSRHALSHTQVRELFESCERDEDTVVLRFLVETGCRREGLLNLTRRDVRPARQTVWLDEKNSARREQPVSRAMTLALLAEDCPLYDLTRRQMDGVWNRVRRQVPWAEDLGVSSHWMRHYAISSIEQVAGYATAAAFAGHRLVRGATASYVKVGLPEVATAFSHLWGEPHPCATPHSPEAPASAQVAAAS
ncbi:tyrosine-type recombinase/integrase [Blastococcus sp. SYSU DS0539]